MHNIKQDMLGVKWWFNVEPVSPLYYQVHFVLSQTK